VAWVSLRVLDEARLRRRLGWIRDVRTPRARRRLTRRVSRMVLRETVQRNPVDTGRAWVESLEQLGGSAPAGWEGSHPESDAIAEGRGRSRVVESGERHLSEVAAVSGVDYINYLEFGTRKMSPVQMVLQRLLGARTTVPRQPFFAAAAEETGSGQ